MSEPYIGEIRMFAGTFAPAGWSMCDGQLMPISQNDALFTLIGTTYGGDGQETFGLPNIQSRVPIHMGTGSSGTNYQLAETGGAESVTLTTNQIPIHNHAFVGTTRAANEPSPQGKLTAASAQVQWARIIAPNAALSNTAVSPVGGSQPHENMQPYLVITYIISLFGVFPQQN
jgi:microcystin-dependent protein